MSELLVLDADAGPETVAELRWTSGFFSSAFGETRAILGFGGASFDTPSSFLLVDLRDRRVVPIESDEPIRAVAIDEEHGVLALIASGRDGEEGRAAFGVLDESGRVRRSTRIPGDTHVGYSAEPVRGPGRIGWIDLAPAPEREVHDYEAASGTVRSVPLAGGLAPRERWPSWVDAVYRREQVVVAASVSDGPHGPVRIWLDHGDGTVQPGSARLLEHDHHLSLTAWGDRLALAHRGRPPGIERGPVMLSIISADDSLRELEVRDDVWSDALTRVRVTPVSERALAIAWTEPECSGDCDRAESYSVHVRVMCPDLAR